MLFDEAQARRTRLTGTIPTSADPKFVGRLIIRAVLESRIIRTSGVALKTAGGSVSRHADNLIPQGEQIGELPERCDVGYLDAFPNNL